MFSGTCAEQCKPQSHFQPRWRHVFSLHVSGSVSHSVQTRCKGSFLHPSFSTVDCVSRFRFVSNHNTPVDSKASYLCSWPMQWCVLLAWCFFYSLIHSHWSYNPLGPTRPALWGPRTRLSGVEGGHSNKEAKERSLWRQSLECLLRLGESY